MYRIDAGDQRRGFRHELASTLALFGVLQRHAGDHPALLGPWRELLTAISSDSEARPDPEDSRPREPTTLEREILNLGAENFDLLAYLVCSHHGKVRMAWHASPADQKSGDTDLRIRGVREGDILPTLPLATADGTVQELAAVALDLSPAAAGLSPRTGISWTERVLGLLARHGPFALAWMEALLRAADQRVSRRLFADPLLQNDNADYELETGDSALAQSAARGAPPASPPGHSAPRRALHGNGGRTGGRKPDSGTTRLPHSATRYLETSLGILSYQHLAPLLAERVAGSEATIAEGAFAGQPILDTLLALHQRVCGDLVPDIAGRWRRRNVLVGDHQPPPFWRVPESMHDYAADLEARLERHPETPDERLIEDLVFAEGRLLNIHPFEDFNGRVTRLFLIVLMYRLDLPIIDPATSPGDETNTYFAALRAWDRRDPRPLAAIWRHRLEQEV